MRRVIENRQKSSAVFGPFNVGTESLKLFYDSYGNHSHTAKEENANYYRCLKALVHLIAAIVGFGEGIPHPHT